jgi:hypothetical protein
VDFILHDRKKAVPVEVKIRDKLSKKDLGSLKKFMQRFNCRQAVLIIPSIYFGLLTGLAMLIALLGALTLLPQLLVVFKPFGPGAAGNHH